MGKDDACRLISCTGDFAHVRRVPLTTSAAPTVPAAQACALALASDRLAMTPTLRRAPVS